MSCFVVPCRVLYTLVSYTSAEADFAKEELEEIAAKVATYAKEDIVDGTLGDILFAEFGRMKSLPHVPSLGHLELMSVFSGCSDLVEKAGGAQFDRVLHVRALLTAYMYSAVYSPYGYGDGCDSQTLKLPFHREGCTWSSTTRCKLSSFWGDEMNPVVGLFPSSNVLDGWRELGIADSKLDDVKYWCMLMNVMTFGLLASVFEMDDLTARARELLMRCGSPLWRQNEEKDSST